MCALVVCRPISVLNIVSQNKIDIQISSPLPLKSIAVSFIAKCQENSDAHTHIHLPQIPLSFTEFVSPPPGLIECSIKGLRKAERGTSYVNIRLHSRQHERHIIRLISMCLTPLFPFYEKILEEYVRR